jgi:hypothetical protein
LAADSPGVLLQERIHEDRRATPQSLEEIIQRLAPPVQKSRFDLAPTGSGNRLRGSWRERRTLIPFAAFLPGLEAVQASFGARRPSAGCGE